MAGWLWRPPGNRTDHQAHLRQSDSADAGLSANARQHRNSNRSVRRPSPDCLDPSPWQLA